MTDDSEEVSNYRQQVQGSNSSAVRSGNSAVRSRGSNAATNVDTQASSDISSARNAGLVGAAILLSRLSGLLREVVLSATLGASTIFADAFAAALTIPKVLQNLLGEGALSASFIPEYSRLLEADKDDARRLAGAVFTLLVSIVTILVALIMSGSTALARFMLAGAGGEEIELTARLLRVMTPGIGFIVLAAWCLGVLNAHRDFFLSYVAPALWNVAIIGFVFGGTHFATNQNGVALSAAFGVLVGGVSQLVVQLPRVFRLAGSIRPNLDFSWGPLRRVIARLLPGVAGRGVLTLGSFTDLFLASFLVTGAFSILSKALVLYMLPISVFAVSIAAADLPELSRNAATLGDADDTVGKHDTVEQHRIVSERISLAVERVVFFLLFSSVVFIFAGRPLVATLFERGEFLATDTIAVWLTLAAFALGLVASGLSRVLQAASFAHGDVKGPALIALIRLVVSATVGALLMFRADHFTTDFDLWPEQLRTAIETGFTLRELAPEHLSQFSSAHLGAVGLAIGGGVAAWVELAMLMLRLRRVGIADLGFLSTLGRLAPAAVISAQLLILGQWLFSSLDLAGPVALTAQTALIITIAGLCYVGIAAHLGLGVARALFTVARRTLGFLRR